MYSRWAFLRRLPAFLAGKGLGATLLTVALTGLSASHAADKVVVSDLAAGDFFGTSVSLDGDLGIAGLQETTMMAAVPVLRTS